MLKVKSLLVPPVVKQLLTAALDPLYLISILSYYNHIKAYMKQASEKQAQALHKVLTCNYCVIYQ